MAVSLQDAAGLALTFVLFVVVVGVGSTVLMGVRTTQQTLNGSGALNPGEQTLAYNTTTQGLIGVNNLANQSGVLGTILGAAVIIGVLLSAFYMSRQ